jgi:hypothetical protein
MGAVQRNLRFLKSTWRGVVGESHSGCPETDSDRIIYESVLGRRKIGDWNGQIVRDQMRWGRGEHLRGGGILALRRRELVLTHHPSRP